MRAAVLNAFNRPMEIQEVNIPVPADDEALVKVAASGLCATDLHIQQGKLAAIKPPLVPGHETCGVIVEIGSLVTRFKTGDRIIVAIDLVCGHCRYCLRGQSNLCRNLRRYGFEENGGHAEFIKVKESCLVKVPANVSLNEMCIIPDAVACMYNGLLVKGKISVGDNVGILGIGGLGMQGIQIAKAVGATVFCTSRTERKLEIAKELGADHLINSAAIDPAAYAKKYTDGLGLDVIIDNIGIESSIDLAARMLRPGGIIVGMGYITPTFFVSYQDFLMKEKQIVGTRGSSRQDLIETVKLVELGLIKPYVTDVFPLEEINESLDKLEKGQIYGRAILLP